ncbi:MAG: sugar transferase [Kiloniellales bacterium]|nr:sugar transferase [Kiloniellales bacterium]
MAELRRTLAGVASATSLRKAPKGSVSTKGAQVDWQILAADFAIIACGLGLARPTLQLIDWSGLGIWPAGSFQQLQQPFPSGEAVALSSVLALAGAAVAVWYFWFRGHYLRRRSSWDRLGDLAFVSGTLVAAEALASWQGLPGALQLPALLAMWIMVAALLLAGRLGLRRHLERRGLWRRPAVVLGGGGRAREVARAVAQDEDLGLDVTHILQLSEPDSKDKPETAVVAGREVPVLVTDDPLAALFLRFRDHVILIAPPPEQFAAVDKLVPTLASLCPTVGVALPTVGLAVEGAATQVLLKRDLALVWMQNRLMRPEWRFLKRCFDVLTAAGALIVTSPVLLTAAVLIRCLDGAPVFVTRQRIGRHGKIFRLIKFRTTHGSSLEEPASANAKLSGEEPAFGDAAFEAGAPGLTPLGRLLRLTGVDELPQLWNALMGDMSFVGPQPLLRREVGDYGGNLHTYLTARPGLFGLWQISGRGRAQPPDRARLDGWYLRNWSLWTDIVILLKTVRLLLGRGRAHS